MPVDAEKTRKAIIADLTVLDPRTFVMRWLFDTLPILFANSNDWVDWRVAFARALEVDPCSIYIVGSSSIGISLAPDKNLRAQRADSDVDVAVASSHHFELAWRWLRMANVSLTLTSQQRDAVTSHRNNYLFAGTITTDKILHLLPFGAAWFKAINDFKIRSPVNGRPLKIRLYRDQESLITYHELGARTLRSKLESIAGETEIV